MDVEFLTLRGKKDEKPRRFQYIAIVDATPVCVLKIYENNTQANATNFVDHVIEKFPFCIREVRIDNGQKLQANLHWHI